MKKYIITIAVLLCVTGVAYSQAPTPTPQSVIFYGAGDAAYDGVYCPAGLYNTCRYYNNRLNGNYQLRQGDTVGQWALVDIGVSQYELTGNCAADLTGTWTATGGGAPVPQVYMGACAPTPLTSPTITPAQTPTPTPTVTPTPSATPTAIPTPSITPSPSPTPQMKPHSGRILGTQILYGRESSGVYRPVAIESDGTLKITK